MDARKSHTIILLVLSLGLPWTVGCRGEQSYPSRPISIICPWAAGGGTDQVARQLAMHLEQELDVPVNVINATGGKGVAGHNRGLTAPPDGYTLTMITFELNTMHWMGLTDLTFRDCIPLVSVNEDYAALLVRSDAPWHSLQELESEIRGKPGSLTASGTASGGAWHLALAGWLIAAGVKADDVIWIPSEGANPSLQQLISGGVHMVCCSLPEARTLIEGGQVRALGVMAPERQDGFEEIATFDEQGRQWTLGGWRGVAVPLNTPPDRVDLLVDALENVVRAEPSDGSFAEFMQAQKFNNAWRGPEEFVAFLDETDTKLGKLLSSDAMQSVTEDRFSPMAYPYALLGLIGVTLAGLLITGVAQREAKGTGVHDQADELDEPSITRYGMVNFALIVLAVVAFIYFAETVGFLLFGAALLTIMLIQFGTRPLPSLLITVAFVPAIYFLFAYLLRVSLPRGWLG